MPLFDSNDYKKFIREQIELNAGVRGYQSKLAEAAHCQKSYLSRVLHSDDHLNPDQAIGLAQHWNLGPDEIDWFLELVELARAQTEPLKKRIRERLKTMKAKHEDLSHHFKKPRIGTSEKENLYYSSWHWSALHILTSIPAFRRVEVIAERLNLPRELVRDCLSKLELLGLVQNRGGEWKNVPGGLYLPKESHLSRNHHANWRQRALLDAQLPERNSIHYTDVVSHSFVDYETVKERLLEVIEASRKIIKPSKEEELSCVCIDFFRV